MAVLGAEVDDDDALVHRFLAVIFIRSDALQSFGDLEIGRHFQVIAGGDPASLGQFTFSRGSTSWMALFDCLGLVSRGKSEAHARRKTELNYMG